MTREEDRLVWPCAIPQLVDCLGRVKGIAPFALAQQNGPRLFVCGDKVDVSLGFSRGSVPHQWPNDDARNGSSPAAFLRTAHCRHTVSNCLPTYVCKACPNAVLCAAALPAPVSIAPTFLLTKAYRYTKKRVGKRVQGFSRRAWVFAEGNVSVNNPEVKERLEVLRYG